MSRPMGAVLFSLALLLLAACSPAQPILVTDQPSPEIVYPAIHPTPTDALCHYVDQVLPDPVCTPGVTDPAVTQQTIAQTICQPGYTSHIRPPTEYTDRVKTERLRAYGQSPVNRSRYELDHLIPLELGGSPSDVGNLWPEPQPSYHDKDRIENELHAAVCAGRVLLADAQQRIVHDWRSAR